MRQWIFPDLFSSVAGHISIIAFVILDFANFIAADNPIVTHSAKDEISGSAQSGFWCYKCASPRNHESTEMVDAMDQLLKLRKTQYPFESITQDCHKPYNLSKLSKDYCRYPWCYVITFSDGEGLPLSIRGCAEKYVAANNLRAQCEKIHTSLDIEDCMCPSGNTLCMNNGSLRNSRVATTFIFLLTTVGILSNLL